MHKWNGDVFQIEVRNHTMHTSLLDAIKKELSESTPRRSLQVENHLYGCFLAMEDIAQGHLTQSTDGRWLSGPHFAIDLEQRFGHIGLRYGFMSDYAAQLTDASQEYQQAWRTLFDTLANTKDLAVVDAVEDAVNELIDQTVPNGFFMRAIETGRLSMEHTAHAYELLFPDEMARPAPEVPIDQTALTNAKTETPMHPSSHPMPVVKTHSRLARTRRRHRPAGEEKKHAKRPYLAHTRRSMDRA